MINIKLYLTLSVALLSMNYVFAIDKQRCEASPYRPAEVASDPRSETPSMTIAPKYKFCSGTMVIESSEAMDSNGKNRNFLVKVTSTEDDIVCKKITSVISVDKADKNYLKSHKQLEFHACLKPRDAARLALPDASVTIGDVRQSVPRSEKTWLIVKLYGSNQALERIIHRNRINQIFINENDKDDKGDTLVFPEDGATCSMEIINNLAAYQGFMVDKFEKDHSSKDSIKCGDFLDGPYMINPITLPHYKDKFYKTATKETPENELIQAIAGKYASQVEKYPNFKGFGELGEKFTWKEFLDKALNSPFADKLEVGDGHGFRSIE